MPFSRRLRPGLLAALLASSAFGATAASAQETRIVEAAEPPLRMTWESDDPACRGDDVSARALRLVSPGVVPRPLQARVEVRRDNERWLVRLETKSGESSGRRILRAESCRELEQAIALLLAMAMESRGDVLPNEPPPSPTATPDPVSPPAAGAPPPVQPAASNRDLAGDGPTPEVDVGAGLGVGWFLRVDGKAGYGLQPGLGLGAGVAAGLRLGDFDVGAGAAYWPSTRAPAPNRSGYLELSRQDFSLRVCWNVWRAGDFTLAPCVAPALTLFRHETKQVRIPSSDTSGPYPNITAGLDLRYAFVGDSLSILVSPGLTLDRARPFGLALADEGPANEPLDSDLPTEEVYRTGRFGPRLELGVDARF